MFWRGRKRKEAVPKEEQKAETLPADHTPESATTSNDEDDTAEPHVNHDEEDSLEEEKWDENPKDESQSPPAPPATLSPEERLERKRQDAMQAQRVSETQALGQNTFCKNQRVRYLHKASGRYFEAVVVAVHFDDGVDRPYFTVRYEKDNETMEKQTTIDRLSYIAFDEAKTYEIISSKIKL